MIEAFPVPAADIAFAAVVGNLAFDCILGREHDLAAALAGLHCARIEPSHNRGLEGVPGDDLPSPFWVLLGPLCRPSVDLVAMLGIVGFPGKFHLDWIAPLPVPIAFENLFWVKPILGPRLLSHDFAIVGIVLTTLLSNFFNPSIPISLGARLALILQAVAR